MKLNRKYSFLILLLALAIGLTGYRVSASATRDANELIQQRLQGAVVIYSGSMYALVDNKLQVIDPANELITPFVQNNRTLVPIRFIAESFDARVSWNQASQTATVITGDKTVKIKINNTAMTVGDKTVALDVPATVTGDRTFIPLRAVSEALGKAVFYNRGLVIISSTLDIFDTATEAQYIDRIIGTVNILPTVDTREKLVGMLNGIGSGGGVRYSDAAVLSPAPTNAPASAAADSKSAAQSNQDYSQTNVQVEGVDEADIVKNDGNYIYQINNQNLLIYKAYPVAEMALAGKIAFSDGQFSPLELYIYGDKLVVIGSSHYNRAIPMPEPMVKGQSHSPIYNDMTVKALVYDVSNRSKPVKVREVSLPGYYVSSRLIGNDLYLVSNQNIYDWQGNTTLLNPKYQDSAVGSDLISIPYDQIKYMPPIVNSSYLMVAGLCLDDLEKPLNVEAYLGAGEEIYVSQNNLYVSVNEGYGGIRPMRMMDNDLWMPPVMQEATLIYKFQLKDATATYQARGQVPGRILNQFSMDEHSGNFRIATTLNDWTNGQDASSNNVYILDGNLNMTGKLENLAKGEKIYSVRFMGNRAYVVTFQSIDPLFVIDLGDPWNPSVLGALKIPGYSDYLHPYDETHLIGFGKDTVTVPVKDGSGKVVNTATYALGMKVALFDVSDVSHPVEKYTVKIGDRGTESELLNDHKALLFNKDKQLLAFPVNEAKVDGPVFDPDSGYPNYGKTVFNGAYVYNLNLEDGFVLKGKISHLSAEDDLKSGYYTVDYDKQIRRMLYIGNVLYGVSNNKLSAYNLYSLKELNAVSGN